MNVVTRMVFAVAAVLSAAIALVHVAIAVMGPSWYRYFGAPELAAAAEDGEGWPAVLTLAVAVVFAVWSAYALAGAGLLRRLPLLRSSLLSIGALYAARGLLLIPQLGGIVPAPERQPRFLAFSAVSLLAGACYLIGTARGWRTLSQGTSRERSTATG